MFYKNILKKSQMEIMQTMIILIVFFILIVFSLIFFYRFQLSETSVKLAEFNEKTMIEKAQEVYILGELGCSTDNVIKYDCIDLMKLDSFKLSLSNPANYIYYRGLLGFIKIEIEEIYPSYRKINYTGERALYDGKPGFLYNSRPIQIPVSLFNATDTTVGSYYFGVLTVTSYFRVTDQ